MMADEPSDQDLVRKADQALYEAKRAGRNRVRVYAEEALEPETTEDQGPSVDSIDPDGKYP